MIKKYFAAASLGALFGTVTYVFVLMQVVSWFGEAAEKGIIGLAVFGIIYFPIFIPVTLLIAYFLSKRISDPKKLESALYKIAILIGLMMGIIIGLI